MDKNENIMMDENMMEENKRVSDYIEDAVPAILTEIRDIKDYIRREYVNAPYYEQDGTLAENYLKTAENALSSFEDLYKRRFSFMAQTEQLMDEMDDITDVLQKYHDGGVYKTEATKALASVAKLKNTLQDYMKIVNKEK